MNTNAEFDDAKAGGASKRELEALKDQLRAAQERLSYAQARLLDFANVSGSWMFETDSDNRFTWLSDNVETITGIKPGSHHG